MTEAIKRFNAGVLDPETRRKPVDIFYSVFAMVMLLHHIYVTVYYPVSYDRGWLIWAMVGFAVVTAALGKLWKDIRFWLLLALLLLRTLRIDVSQEDAGTVRNEVFFIGLYAYFGCYGAGRALKNPERFLMIFCAVWTAAMVVFSCLGIYTGVTGISIPNLGRKAFYIREFRLNPVYHFVEAGIMASAGIAVAALGFCISAKSALKWLYVPAALVIFVAGALTATRTGYVINAMTISLIVCMVIYEKIPERFRREGKQRIITLLLIIGMFGVMMILLTLLQTKFLPAFQKFREQGGVLITRAMAEGEQDSSLQIVSRGFEMNEGVDGLMTGRLTIWKETMQTIGQKPMILLWGESAHMPREMEAINSIREAEGLYKIHHTHNEFIQILVENGIPGLALFAAFIVLFLRDAYRLITNRTLRFWQRAIPIPALGCLMAETVDITARANGDLPQMTILFLFIGFTAVLAGQTKPKRRMA